MKNFKYLIAWIRGLAYRFHEVLLQSVGVRRHEHLLVYTNPFEKAAEAKRESRKSKKPIETSSFLY